MTQEALRMALEAMNAMLTHMGMDEDEWNKVTFDQMRQAIKAAEEALAQPEQEPVAWQTIEAKYPTLEKLDIRMGDGSILCSVWPQSDGDLWWEGSGTGEKFIDPKYANVTHWRVHSDTTPPQRTWVELTDEDKHEIELRAGITEDDDGYIVSQVFELTEAKLKEKNNA